MKNTRILNEHGPQMEEINNADWADPERLMQTSAHVDNSSWPGSHDFWFTLEEPSSRAAYTYSSRLNRLYIDYNRAVPIKFHWDGAATLHVRALMVYTEPDHERNAVLRCRLHADASHSSNHDHQYIQHVLKCENVDSIYCVNRNSNRHSVISFLGQKPNGADAVSITYKFMCKTSCVGGINRNKTDVVFTLEDSNHQVVGRAVLGVKICACPRRDKEKDETPVTGKKRRMPDQSHQVHESALQHFGPRVVKEEAGRENFGLVDYVVRVPQLRTTEFEEMIRRWLYVGTVPQEAINAATAGCVTKL